MTRAASTLPRMTPPDPTLDRPHVPTTAPTTAIVIGASMAGLAAARVLADHADRVVVFERDRLPVGPQIRRFVPQGRHAHVLLASGQRLLEGWFPGLAEDLVIRGAVPLHAKDMVWHQAGAHRVRSNSGFVALSMSRPLLETTVREHLLRRRNVTIVDEVHVDGPIVERDRVVGVSIAGEIHRGDLVVDCSGHGTRFLDQLHVAGFPAPEVSEIRMSVAHATRVLYRRPDDLDGTVAVVHDDPANGNRIATMLPIEDDRWMLTVGGVHGDVPPTDPRGFANFVRSRPSPEIADVLDRAEALTPVRSHRTPTSRRRHVERLERPPAGFVVLGDAICNFNPVYGQGMAVAAQQADALARTLDRHGLAARRLPRAFYRRAAKVVDTPWSIAATADFADPRTTGAKPAGTDVANRWLARVQLASHTSRPVADRLLRVQNLQARPTSLATPSMVARVLWSARRSPAARAARRGASASTRPGQHRPTANLDARLLAR